MGRNDDHRRPESRLGRRDRDACGTPFIGALLGCGSLDVWEKLVQVRQMAPAATGCPMWVGERAQIAV